MRKKNLEIKDPQQIREILDRGQVCHIAMHDEPYPYLVVMNYAVDYSGDQTRLYFHCADEGKKLDLIQKNPNVCFEIHRDEILDYNESRQRCTMFYESVTGFGRMHMAKAEEKKAILDALMAHYYGEVKAYNDAAIPRTTCLILDVDTMTGKKKG